MSALLWAETLDRRLLSVPRWLQVGCVAAAVAACVAVGIHDVPRPYVDYSRTVLRGVPQPLTYGPDTIADVYESSVVLNDPSDMYTKRRQAQTAIEAATWSKTASSPYPPAALLALAAVDAVGTRTGVGFYGVMLILACLFLSACAIYCLQTRWYVFLVMCVNAPYIAERLVYVQDDTYLLMLLLIMGAMFLARARRPICHLFMAIAIAVKLAPLYYLKNVFSVGWPRAVLMVGIVTLGLVLPYFLWTGYGSIYQFQIHRKGHYLMNAVGAAAFVLPLTLLIAYLEARLDFDVEDRIGWSVVPGGLFLSLTMNAPRHLFVALLVPDKRAWRTIAGALGFAVSHAFAGAGASTSTMTALVGVVLVGYVARVGWTTVRGDLGHPLRTMDMLLLRRQPAAPPLTGVDKLNMRQTGQ